MKCSFGFWSFDLELVTGHAAAAIQSWSSNPSIPQIMGTPGMVQGYKDRKKNMWCSMSTNFPHPSHSSHSMHVKVLHYDVSSTSSVCWQWGQLRNNSQHINTTVVETHPAIAHGIGSWMTSKWPSHVHYQLGNAFDFSGNPREETIQQKHTIHIL